MKKFQELTQGNQEKTGTPENIRREVMTPIIQEHPENLEIQVNGVKINLKANWSVSGKTLYWAGDLTADEYRQIVGHSGGLMNDTKKNPPFFLLDGTGRATIYAGGKYFERFLTNEKIRIL